MNVRVLGAYRPFGQTPGEYHPQRYFDPYYRMQMGDTEKDILETMQAEAENIEEIKSFLFRKLQEKKPWIDRIDWAQTAAYAVAGGITTIIAGLIVKKITS
jgi:hypothetical protein